MGNLINDYYCGIHGDASNDEAEGFLEKIKDICM